MPTVLITGANRGIGLAFARHYVEAGWRVLATCRRPEAAQELSALGEGIAVHRMDVTDDGQIRSVAAAVGGEPIDLLVNNAGVGGKSSGEAGEKYATGLPPLDGANLTAWQEQVFLVNAIGPFRVTCAFLGNLTASEGRRVVTISSGLGSIAGNTSGGQYPYRTSKAAANMVMRGLAHDLAGRRIIAVALNPGWVRTRLGGDRAPKPAAQAAAELAQVIDRLKPEDSGKFLDYDGRELPW